MMISRIFAGIIIGSALGSVMGYVGKCNSGTCPLTSTPGRGAVYGGIIGLLFAFSMGDARNADSSTQKDSAVAPAGKAAVAGKGTAEKTESPLHIENAKEFEEYVLGSGKPCLVDFYSNTCPPCRKLAPTIDRLAKQYYGEALICKVSLDGGRNSELVRRYRIRGIPAVLFFADGGEVDRLVGLRDKADYAAVLDGLIFAGKEVSEEKESTQGSQGELSL